jgi:nucleoside phosphorylase
LKRAKTQRYYIQLDGDRAIELSLPSDLSIKPTKNGSLLDERDTQESKQVSLDVKAENFGVVEDEDSEVENENPQVEENKVSTATRGKLNNNSLFFNKTTEPNITNNISYVPPNWRSKSLLESKEKSLEQERVKSRIEELKNEFRQLEVEESDVIRLVFYEFLRFSKERRDRLGMYSVIELVDCLQEYFLEEASSVNFQPVEMLHRLFIHLAYDYDQSERFRESLEQDSSTKIDVLVIAALDIELDALLDCSPGWSKKNLEEQDYWQKTFKTIRNRKFTIAAATSGKPGRTKAVQVATLLKTRLKPNCFAMIGICAGNPDKVFQGDVIVADKIVDISPAEQRSTSEGLVKDISDIKSYNLESPWQANVKSLAKSWVEEFIEARPKSKQHQEWWLLDQLRDRKKVLVDEFRTNSEREKQCPDWNIILQRLQSKSLIVIDGKSIRLTEKGENYVNEDYVYQLGNKREDSGRVTVHLGSIGTGNSVQKIPGLFKELSENKGVRSILGIEMEAIAIGEVADGKPTIVVKAVQDYADLEKDHQFRRYACEASARFLLHFLKKSHSFSELLNANP